MKKEMLIAPEEIEKSQSFTKTQLVHSSTYFGQKDLVEALLENNKSYTHEQVLNTIQTFSQREAE